VPVGVREGYQRGLCSLSRTYEPSRKPSSLWDLSG
jgi:hypothetical protein